MRRMALVDRFYDWVEGEIGSAALPAVRQHLRDRDYRLVSFTEHGGRCVRDVYHPERGFFRAAGRDDAEALLAILRQVWLVEALGGAQEAGSRTAE
ncbi:MAG: hypothetical protein ACREID_02170 [Planctomycetota bacterium]